MYQKSIRKHNGVTVSSQLNRVDWVLKNTIHVLNDLSGP